MTMGIDRTNFKTWYRLYLEGDLDQSGMEELMSFLSANPDIEFSPDEDSINTKDIFFGKKSTLKKSYSDIPDINKDNFDEFCVARLEKLLSRQDNERIDSYLRSHPEKEKDARIISKLKMVPDEGVRFRKKSSLKKAVPVLTFKKFAIPLSIAAAVIFIFLALTVTVRKDPSLPPIASEPVIIAVPLPQYSLPGNTVSVKAAGLSVRQASVPVQQIQQQEVFKEAMAEEFQLAVIEPVNPVILLPVVNEEKIVMSGQDIQLAGNGNEEYRNQGILKDINLWETTVLAVKGFNILTESDLSVERTPESDGKVRISLDSGGKTIIAARVKN
jgi:hypothetical protein